jgi:hypothetical protein
LLFNHPYAPQAQNLEGQLWLETSHALISLYRQRISSLEKTLNSQENSRSQHRQSSHGPVEYRKLVQKFRNFLSAEESFWSGFVLRLVRAYSLDEAKPALEKLAISSPDPLLAAAAASAARNADPTRSPQLSQTVQQQSPRSPIPPGQREKKLLILHKALICLGDLARYREQYNDVGVGGGRNGRQGKEFGRNGRDSGSGKFRQQDNTPRPKNFTRAMDCYQQARLLAPDNGNPSHQLAILSLHAGDVFSSTLHYYRALCIRQPFPTAQENLEKTLGKALEKHRKVGRNSEPQPAETPLEALQRDVVLLHALWFLKSRLSHLIHIHYFQSHLCLLAAPTCPNTLRVCLNSFLPLFRNAVCRQRPLFESSLWPLELSGTFARIRRQARSRQQS